MFYFEIGDEYISIYSPNLKTIQNINRDIKLSNDNNFQESHIFIQTTSTTNIFAYKKIVETIT